MADTLTATYENQLAVKNAYEDLIGKGIPRSNIVTRDASNQIEVAIATESQPEIREILQRHQPIRID